MCVCVCVCVVAVGKVRGRESGLSIKHFKSDKEKKLDKPCLLIAEAISSEHQLKQKALIWGEK